MRSHHRSLVLLVVGTAMLRFLILPDSAVGQETAFRAVDPAPESTATRRERMVRHIDMLLRQQCQQLGVQPAALASDGEFLRRATLDLQGVIPRVWEVREFLADVSAHKRQRLVERLLTSPRYATHMATVWRNRILPAGSEATHARAALGLQTWLRTRFASNLRYDGLVAGLLLATGEEALGATLYFQANDLAPEKLAASVSELFLGVELRCAQCHDHPQADWSQQDFWGLAAFFAQVEAPADRGRGLSYRLVDTNRGEVRLPDSQQIVAPKVLLSRAEVDEPFGGRRASFVLWLTSRDNRFFARAGVNWAWMHLFGKGLVDSVGEIVARGQDAEPHHAINEQLLVDLAEYLVDSGFDLQELLRTIASTRAYQQSSWHDHPELATPELFARMLPKPLTPEQLFDSFLLLSPQAMPIQNQAVGPRSGAVGGLAADPRRTEFVRRMREPPGPATEYRSGTLQALMLMNGTVTAELTAHDRSRWLGALTAPFMNDEDRIEALFLAALCRPPDGGQQRLCLELLHDSQTEAERSRVLGDILWALANSTEFAFNR